MLSGGKRDENVEVDSLATVLLPAELRSIAKCKGDSVAYIRELLWRAGRPDLAADGLAVQTILRIACEQQGV